MNASSKSAKALPRVVVLTGAGISADSGIATFRDANGLWENHAIEDVATPEAYDRNPQLVHQFYNARRRALLDPATKPNAGHYALAELENFLGDNFLLVTQNIDNLHERAGSRRLLHMHGELLKMRSVLTGQTLTWEVEATENSVAQAGYSLNTLRPDIVWFGEIPMHMDAIQESLAKCDYFLSVGTSGTVYPAAGFCAIARSMSAKCYEINLQASDIHDNFDHHIYGRASEVLPGFIREFINSF